MRTRFLAAVTLVCALLLTAGCAVPGKHEFQLGRKAQELQDYDSALVYYERALRQDPRNAQYRIRVAQMRFQAAQAHVELGEQLMARGDLNDVETALGNFQRAYDIDPSSAIAGQMIQKALLRISELKKTAEKPAPEPGAKALADLEQMPPVLKTLPDQRINLKATNDARIIYETIAKLAGLTVLFDPDFQSQRISIDLPNVTLNQALEAVARESKSFWVPMTSNIIFVAPDNVQKRREFENEIVKTIYLRNSDSPQQLTEIVGGLRQLLQLQRIQQINTPPAVVIRDTPAKVMAAEKIIDDLDKQRAEVMLQVSVLEVNQNRLRDLGIQPGTSATLAFTPRSAIQPSSSSSSSSSSGSTSTSVPEVTLNNLRHLSSADYSLTLPGAAVQALLTDSTTKIVQNPEIMVTDGQKASLRIGDRVPIATGSFQAGLGTTQVGAVSPLVNTQFQYQDVGVNIDVTPQVHPDQDVSLEMEITVSSVSGYQSIGGIQQPIISQRKITDNVRLRNGQVSVLGGLVQHTTTKSVSGWPGFEKIPFLRYFFTQENTQQQNDEVLIVLTPHVVRMPNVTEENLASLFTGTGEHVTVQQQAGATEESSAGVPVIPPPSSSAPSAASASTVPASPAQPKPANEAALAFEPASVSLPPGGTTTIALVVRNAADLYSVPMILRYDPKVIAVEDVRNGGFLSGGSQPIAIFHHEDAKLGQSIISVMRPPNVSGVNGNGTLVGVVVKALAPGDSTLTIAQVGAKNSAGKPIDFAAGTATIHVGNPK